MRALVAFFLALSLLLSASGQVLAQQSRSVPPGVEPIPGYPGLYVADAKRFMAGSFVVVMLTRPRDVRGFLSQVKSCASQQDLAARLQREGLSTFVVPFREVSAALRTGACTVYIGANFDFAQLNRPLNPDGRRPDDDSPPPQDDAAPDDDVAIDRTPPDIAPLEQVFSGQGDTVAVSARITDRESGIRAAYVVMPDGGQVQMAVRQEPSIYSTTVNLPRNYEDQTVFILATNAAKLTTRVPVTLRLIPWCGPREVVGRTLVRDVQDKLSCVGLSPGASDGTLGPNTCRAIEGYLRDRTDRFNSGRISWAALRDELDRACYAAQPVELDVPGRIEVDGPRTTVRIGLHQPGLTETIRLTGPGIGTQTQTWRGQPLFFDLPMPPLGRDATLRVEALGPDGDALDRATLQLVRPSAILTVRPSGRVTTDDPRVDFTATMPRGASAIARIEARRPDAAPIVEPFASGSAILSVPSPEPGSSQTVTFIALDRLGNPLARQTVTVDRSQAVVPLRLTINSPDGKVVDASTVRLQVLLENPGAAAELVLRVGPEMSELMGRPVGNGIWYSSQAMPPPGQDIVFLAQAVDRNGRVLAEESVRVERAPVQLQTQPAGRYEADSNRMTAQARVTSGVDWITTIAARAAQTGPDGGILAKSAPAEGQARLELNMPEPGNTLQVNVVAIGRDGKVYASQPITLVRPSAQLPIALYVTSPDGFAVDADSTRLSVNVTNPADTAEIVVSDPRNGEVLARGRYAGTDWLGQVIMPPPGQDRALVVEAQNAAGQTLATSQIMLLRPATPRLSVPPWAWIAALVLVSVGSGYLLAMRRAGGRTSEPADKEYRAAARPHIFAEPDHEPSVELSPSSPLTLVVRVDEDPSPDIEIEMEQDQGAER